MGSPIPYSYRQLIIKRRQSGNTYSQISNEIGYSISGIKKIWYAYQKHGSSSFKTAYKNCGRKSSFDETIKEKIQTIRTGNQGAPYVFSRLHQLYQGQPVPSIRTLQYWWQASDTARKRGRPSNKEKKDGLNKHIIRGKLTEKNKLA